MSAAAVVQVGDRLSGAGRELDLVADFAAAAKVGFERLAARGDPFAGVSAGRFARIEDAARELRQELDGLSRAMCRDLMTARRELAGGCE